MVRLSRINRYEEHQVRRGNRWVKPSASEASPEKLKRWRELADKRKRKKDKAEEGVR